MTLRIASPCGCRQNHFLGQPREPLCEEHRNVFKKPGADAAAEKRRQEKQRRASGSSRRSKSTTTPAVPRWLTEGFALGVDQREAAEAVRSAEPYGCWLAQFDTEERPCTDKLERCHIINRQRVEKAVGALLFGAWVEDPNGYPVELPRCDRHLFVQFAAWDPRNARLGCTGHHPPFDSNATPRLYVPYSALPTHVLEFAEDWGLEVELERKCPDWSQPESPTNQGATAPERSS